MYCVCVPSSVICFESMDDVSPELEQNWNKSGTKVYNLPGFEILSKSINMVRYVFKFGYMRCSGLRCQVCEGFVKVIARFVADMAAPKIKNVACLIYQQEL